MLLKAAIEAGAWLRGVMAQWQGEESGYHG